MTIYKTRNTWARNEMKEMFIRFPGNLLENSGEFFHFNIFRGMFEKILENVQEDSAWCLKRFREMLLKIRGIFQKIPGNVSEDSGEYSKRFWGMSEKVLRNAQEDSRKYSRRFREMFEKIPEVFGKILGDGTKDSE